MSRGIDSGDINWGNFFSRGYWPGGYYSGILTGGINQGGVGEIPFLSSLVCIHLGYLRTDISSTHKALLLHLILISVSFIIISFVPNFILFSLQVSTNKLTIICSTLIGYINQPEFIL